MRYTVSLSSTLGQTSAFVRAVFATMARVSMLVGLLGMWLLPVYAQEAAPLIIWANGDLYAANRPTEPPQALTTDGTITAPALSPDGARIAFARLAPVAAEALDRIPADGAIAVFDLPTDISILDVATGETRAVAVQPDDASLFVDGVPDRAIVRGAPAWSPDGVALVWVELDFGALALRLMIADVSVEPPVVRSLTALSVSAINGEVPEVVWGVGGLLVRVAESNAGAQTFAAIGADGASLASIAFTLEEDEIVAVVPVGEVFGVLLNVNGWIRLDPITGAIDRFETTPELVAVGAPESSIAVHFNTGAEGVYWEAIDPLNPGAAAFSAAGVPRGVAIAPDGRTVAFTGYPDIGAAAWWRGVGDVIEQVGTGAVDEGAVFAGVLLWGASVWR